MSDKIRWGVLGNATIARVCVIPAIQKSRNGIVHMLATRFPERAAAVAKENGIVTVVDSYDAVLDDPAVDAVYVPLPNHLHHYWTLKALSTGKHVLCEKPLAVTAREAQEMADAANRARRLLMEAFMYRFHPRSQRIKQLTADGSIGRPCLVHSAFCYHMGEDVLMNGDNYRLKCEMGGGALLDVGCYGVNVARWFFASEPIQVQAQAVYYQNGVDVHFVGSLRFPQNELATIEASFNSALQQTYSVIGSHGAIDLPHDAFIPWENDALFTIRDRNQEKGQEHIIPGADEYQIMVEHFADAVMGRQALAFSPAESVCNMRVLDALAEAARSGITVVL